MTPTQLTILRGISNDQTFKDLSMQLNAPQTKVKDAALKSCEELGVNSLAAAVATALRRQLID